MQALLAWRLRWDEDVQLGAELAKNLVERLRPVESGFPLIRVGADGDGGYLVPDILGEITNCYSPGVSDMAHFELDLARRGISCFLLDGSVPSAPEQHEKIHFERLWLGPHDADGMTSLPSWLRRHEVDEGNSRLLQMDIEGSEYEVILKDHLFISKRFRVLVIEFHGLATMLTDPFGVGGLVRDGLNTLLEHFAVVHVHPNNYGFALRLPGIDVPDVVELTMMRRDFLPTPLRGVLALPHPLDADNAPEPFRRLDLGVPWIG